MNRPSLQITRRICTVLCIGLLLLLQGHAKGANEHFAQNLYGTQIANGQVLTVTDPLFDQLVLGTANTTNYRVQNLITLAIDETNAPYLGAAFDVSVEIEVDAKDELGAAIPTTSTVLNVNYDPAAGVVITDKSAFEFSGGHYVRASIVGVTVNSGSMPSVLRLTNEIKVERYYTFDFAATPSIAANVADQRLQFAWSPLEGAEEYHLEMVWINDYDGTGAFLAPASLEYHFGYNSTRIRTTDNFYQCPFVFDHGYILYRVRGVGRQGTDFEYEQLGAWSNGPDQGNVAAFADVIPVTGSFEDGKFNWSYTASIDDRGKRAEGVSFADGLMMARQSVVLNQTDQKAIVQEIYYDYQGRAVISTLPAPVGDHHLEYYPFFSQGVNGEEYRPEYFDVDATAACEIIDGQMSAQSGAGQYYSPNNPDQASFQAFVPDAEGYPFTRVQYTPDATGRIRRSTALGEDFKLGSTHEMQYYYANPDQDELDRLFGAEVGNAQHYTEVMVGDANGQLSITYQDMFGRTVASMLAGNAPDNVIALDENVGAATTATNMLDATTQQTLQNDNRSLYFTKNFNVTSEGVNNFQYSLNPEEYTDCLPANVCYDCVYDLEISITNDCQQQMISGGPVVITVGQLPLDDACNDPAFTHVENFISLNLPVGQYTLTKTLTVNQEAEDFYTANYLDNSTCVLDYQHFYDLSFQNADFSGCGASYCDLECLQTLGTRDDYIAQNGAGSGAQYDLLFEQCVLDCQQQDPCATLADLMKADVSPNGQYGLFLDANGDVDPSGYPLSVYNTGNSLSTSGAVWNNPSLNYLDAQGNPATITLPDGTTVAPNDPAVTLVDFLANWQPSWADALLPYHPEYCHLAFCSSNLTSHDYDYGMSTTDTYADALAAGYLNPLDQPAGIVPAGIPTPSGNADPFFALGGNGDSQKPAMESELIGLGNSFGIGLSMWETAIVLVHCPDAANASEVNTCLVNHPIGSTACQNDRVWTTFRTLYLGRKQQYYDLLQTNYAIENGCYNGCVGDALFDVTDFDFNCYPVNVNPAFTCALPNSGYAASIDPSQPCSNTTAGLYANKASRVLNTASNIGVLAAGAGSTLNTQVNNAIDASCQSTCESYADGWIIALGDCGITASQETLLRAELIELCVLGCDVDHPFGSTTLPLGTQTAAGNSTFDDVLSSILGANYETALCSPLLIDFPQPYDYNYSGNSTMDECGCDRVLEVQNQYDNATVLPAGVNTAGDLFQTTYGFALDAFGERVCDCNDTYTNLTGNAWTPGAVWPAGSTQTLAGLGWAMPANLNCEQCQSCKDLEGVVTQFNLDNAGFVGTANYFDLLANHLNQQYDFHLGPDAYEDFLENCSTLSTNGVYCEAQPEAAALEDLLNQLAGQGALETDVNTPLALETVPGYAGGALDIPLVNEALWACAAPGGGNLCTATELYLYLGDPTASCEVLLQLPTGSNFTWADITAFDNLEPISPDCDNPGNFQVEATVYQSGQPFTLTLTGNSACIPVQACYCDNNELVLCDVLSELPDPQDDCIDQILNIVEYDAVSAYEDYLEAIEQQFRADYRAQCLAAVASETLTRTYNDHRYHYTLFYYDQSGNLIKTVPPKGVQLVDLNAADPNNPAQTVGDAIDAQRAGTSANQQAMAESYTNHTYQTNYRYDSYNNLQQSNTPDGGTTNNFYDHLGRVAVTQHAQQQLDGKYSYVQYDPIGRLVEVGEIEQPAGAPALTESITRDPIALAAWIAQGTRTEVNLTFYDRPLNTAVASQFATGAQENLRMRVAATAHYRSYPTDPAVDYDNATHYSYDPHGNVVELVKENKDVPFQQQQQKHLEYEFDIVSGNVNEVVMQEGENDEFRHQYCYDADNRIATVSTSKDDQIYDQDAQYYYYQHGPLARTELGEHQVQGCDYVYTINGWLKTKNGAVLDPSLDVGTDGNPNGLSSVAETNQYIAQDATAFLLSYFDGDYHAISNATPNTNAAFEPNTTGAGLTAQAPALYNGNIRHMITSLSGTGVSSGVETQATAYNYDQLHRLRSVDAFRNLNASNTQWGTSGPVSDYHTAITYDQNGNILTLLRNGTQDPPPAGSTTTGGLAMDDFVYNYTPGTNRLEHVDDLQTNANAYSVDLDDQNAGNYTYDAVGRLISDAGEEIRIIEWTYDHKVKAVLRNPGSTRPDLEFRYDDMRMRAVKIVKPRPSGSVDPTGEDWVYTFYVCDASGNLMSTYQLTHDQVTNSDAYALRENYLYGGKRLGQNARNVLMAGGGTIGGNSDAGNRRTGRKAYELTNHLGNVLSTISDRKLGVDDGTGNLSYYQTDITSWSDYYAFGMQMPGRNGQTEGYRYGFNGMENDDEWTGSGSHLDFGARIYDSRLGRWAAIDPLFYKHVAVSPYSGIGNNPIVYRDFDGRDIVVTMTKNPNNGKTVITVTITGVVNFDHLTTTMSAEQKAAYVANVNKEIEDYYRKDFPDLEFRVNSQFSNGENTLIKPDDHVIYITNLKGSGSKVADNVGGFANTIGGKVTYFSKKTDPRTIAHELGHLLGLLHPKDYAGYYANISNSQVPVTYDDIFNLFSFNNLMHHPDDNGTYAGGGDNFDELQARLIYEIYSKNLLNYGTNRFAMNDDFTGTGNPNANRQRQTTLIGQVSLNYIKQVFTQLSTGAANTGATENAGKGSGLNDGKACTVQNLCCFIEGTSIQMASGAVKNIEDVKAGERVLSWDFDKGSIDTSTVSHVSSPNHEDLIEVIFSDSSTLTMTFDHSILVEGKGWCSYKPQWTKERYGIDASQLQKGDTIRIRQNGIFIDAVISDIKETIGSRKTYNLFTTEFNSYIANGIIVHNETSFDETP